MVKRSRPPQILPPAKGKPADLSWSELFSTGETLDDLDDEFAANLEKSEQTMERVARALERLAPPEPDRPDFNAADAFAWHPEGRRLVPVPRVNRVDMALLKGIDRVRDLLSENTERFARGLPANNALLWGARGMGKSSLVKAVHASINAAHAGRKAKGGNGLLKLVEIHREDIESLPELMALVRDAPYRFIVFC